MKSVFRYLTPLIALAVLITDLATARADDRDKERNAYVVTPLVSDLPGVAPTQDPVLQNAWGVTFTPAASPFWIADNATGCSTLYDGDGTKVALQGLDPATREYGAENRLRARHFTDEPNTGGADRCRLEPDD